MQANTGRGLRPDGTLITVRYQRLDSETLSEAAREQAQKLLTVLGYDQPPLFDE